MGISMLSLPSFVRVALQRGLQELRSRGIEGVVTSTFRTLQEQRFLFDQFKRGLSSFPVALPGTSRHEFGLAVDLVALPPSALPVMVEVMRSVGFRWAGPSDSVHFDFLLPLVGRKTLRKAPVGPDAASLGPSRGSPIPKTGAVRPPPTGCCSL